MWLFRKKDWQDKYRQLSDRDVLEKIRSGDELAEKYIWLTYAPLVSIRVDVELYRRGRPPQLGASEDYAHEAIYFLLDKARQIGADAFRHEYTNTTGWLKQTAINFMRKDARDDQWHERYQFWSDDEQVDVLPTVDTLADPDADLFTDLSEKDRDQIVREVMAGESEELQSLLRFRFMDGLSWQQTSERMMERYPGHRTAFTTTYVQKTYWDKLEKKEFCQKIIDAFKRHGYDIRRKR